MKKNNIIIKIWIGLLTFIAGFLNGGFLLKAGTAVSHHTGTITHLALNLSLQSFAEAMPLCISLAAFCAGSCISGILFYDRHFRFAKRYGVLLMTFAAFFLLLALLQPSALITLVITCTILGMQNGMFIFYKDILIRTTHFSGYLTDAGLSLGMVLRGKRYEWKRSLFYFYGIFCFFTGAVVAATFAASSLFFYIVSCFYFLTGLFYFIFRNTQQQQIKP